MGWCGDGISHDAVHSQSCPQLAHFGIKGIDLLFKSAVFLDEGGLRIIELQKFLGQVLSFCFKCCFFCLKVSAFSFEA